MVNGQLLSQAEAGEPDAQYEVGQYYYSIRQYGNAYQWYLTAANKGHGASIESMRDLERNGLVRLDALPQPKMSALGSLSPATKLYTPISTAIPAMVRHAIGCCGQCQIITTTPLKDRALSCPTCARPLLTIALKAPPPSESRSRRVTATLTESIPRLSGRSFENLLLAIFEGFGLTVEQTPATGDFGLDLVVIDHAGIRIGIQAKRYRDDVGVSALQELRAGMEYYSCDRGLLMISSKLSGPGKQLLDRLPTITLLTTPAIVELASRSLGDVLILETTMPDSA